jgi:cleavage and polyadenylation specificity factor subunit 1
MTRNNPSSNAKLIWNDKAIAAFQELKEAVSNAVTLAFPDFEQPIVLVTDASELAVGAALHQKEGGKLRPLCFYSRKFTPTEQQRSAFDRELMAIYFSLKQFEWLLGMSFELRTDHKPLTNCLDMKNPTPQQRRWLSYISEFNATIEHIAGKDNIVADALSRVAAITTMDYETLAAAQVNDEETKSFAANTGLPVSKVVTTKGSVILGILRNQQFIPILPKDLRRDAFEECHSLSHPGVRATQRLLCARYVWRNMKKDIAGWCKNCQACQSSKVHRHTQTPLATIPTTGRFQTVHVDIVGPLPVSRGYRFLVTMIDRFSSWPEAVPVTNISAETVASVLMKHWVSRFGLPRLIVSDRGGQFESILWYQLLRKLGIDHRRTTAYHPQANGMVERFHRSLKNSLRSRCTDNKWVDELPLVLLGLRSAVNVHGFSAAQMVYGSELVLPGTFFAPPEADLADAPAFVAKLFDSVARFKAPKRTYHKEGYVPKELKTSEFVWVKDSRQHIGSLQRPYRGPFKVISTTDKTATLLINGKEDVVSLDRLKPAFGVDTKQCCSIKQKAEKTVRFLELR